MAKTKKNGQTDLKKQLKETAGKNEGSGKSQLKQVHEYLDKMKPEIEKALPRHIGADRLARIAYTTIRTNPKLLNCSMGSLMGSVMQAAQLGLEPNLIGQCYIIPYKNEASFIIGYRGMIDLARRSGNIETIYAHIVRENDEFEYEYGLNQDLKHKPVLEDRGALIGAYMVAKFKDGGYYFEFMPKSEIEKRRKRSPAGNNGPWVTDYEEMAKKTVIRHGFKYLPVSVEIMSNIERTDESQKNFEEMEDNDFVDISPGMENEDESLADEEKELAETK